MTKRSKVKLNIFMGLLILILILPLIIKAGALFLISKELINMSSLTQLLPLSEVKFFQYEYLYKLVLAFSDFNVNFDRIIKITSLFDVLPPLIMMLIFETNRITKRNKHLNKTLLFFLIVYLLKYIGLFITLFIIFKFSLKMMFGFNFFGFWLMFTTFLLFACIIYTGFVYFAYCKTSN